MIFTLDETIEKIKNHPLFQRLQTVVENNPGYHDHEDVYAHATKTARIALSEREGKFITNPQALSSFQDFMNEVVEDTTQRRDIVVLTALLHDCGKILSYREGGKIFTMLQPRANTEDQTICSGHEYWGGKLVAPKILTDVGVSPKVTELVSEMVGLHGTLNDSIYYKLTESWPMKNLLSDVKSKAKGRYIEAMFNAYCDCYDASSFANSKERIVEILNTPELYISREYFIPEE